MSKAILSREYGRKESRTEILELAKQAGFGISRFDHDGIKVSHSNGSYVIITDLLERFAALVAANEREAAAMVCESWAKQHGKQTGDCAYEDCDLMATAIELAQAIRVNMTIVAISQEST